MCPVWQSSRTKSALFPRARFPPGKHKELSRLCCDIFSLLSLPMAVTFFREGECRQFAASSCCSQSKPTDAVIQRRGAAAGLWTTPVRREWTGIHWSVLAPASSLQFWTQNLQACFEEILIPRKKPKPWTEATNLLLFLISSTPSCSSASPAALFYKNPTVTVTRPFLLPERILRILSF